MKKRIISVLILLLAGAAGVYLSLNPARGARQQSHAQPGPPVAAPVERKILYWVDPMHPQYKSDKPGKAPDCGMDLVPVYAGGTVQPAGLPPGAFQIVPERLQLIGVQYDKITYGPLVHTLRTVGKVAIDERRLAHIHTKVTGYVEKVFVDFVGKEVQKGDPLFTIYSPDLVATQQEYLVALRSQNYLKDSPYPELKTNADSLLQAAQERLRLWDIRDEDIDSIRREGKVQRTLTIYSPVSGIVTERAAYHHGRYVSPEMDLYTIVDLSNIWVLADVYEYELPMILKGQTATMSLPGFPGKTFTGQITFISPELDNTTRTAKVRLEFPNPDLSLKPDMYANIQLQINYGSQISVPEEAVLDSGTEQIVFVARGAGYFEPRPVKLGPKADNRYIVLSGLKPGEKIVTSGNFLIDSESRLKSAMSAMAGMPGMPSSGPAPEGAAGPKSGGHAGQAPAEGPAKPPVHPH